MEQDEILQPAQPAASFVAMVRPEDSAAEPVIGQAKPEEVGYWQSQGWIVKE